MTDDQSQSLDLLVVDDEPELCALVQDYMALHGVRTATASNAAVARALVALHAPRVVLLDMVIPGESGLTLGRWLRSQHRGTRVVIMSAAGDLMQLLSATESIAHDCLLKPFTLEELMAPVIAQLDRTLRHPGRSAAPNASPH